MTKYGTEPGLEDTMKSVICGSTDVNHGCQPEKKLLVEEEAFPCDLTSVRPKSSQGLKPMPEACDTTTAVNVSGTPAPNTTEQAQ